jgi:hypothetical protein
MGQGVAWVEGVQGVGVWGVILKAKKIRKKKQKNFTGFKKKSVLVFAGCCVERSIILNLYISNAQKKFTIFVLNFTTMKDINYTGGLYVKNGRLINDRMDGQTGIARVASMKRAVDNDKKINMIAEGIQLAEDKKGFNQLEY